jgi:hypothetical protein
MNSKNLKTVLVGLIMGASLAAVASNHETPRTESHEPVVIGHRVTPQGDFQLVYSK